jgi:hypothetical protein
MLYSLSMDAQVEEAIVNADRDGELAWQSRRRHRRLHGYCRDVPLPNTKISTAASASARRRR